MKSRAFFSITMVVLFFLVLVTGCEQQGTPFDLAALEKQAQSGEGEALRKLVELLGHPTLGDRVYATVLDLGTPAVPLLLEQVKSPDDDRREATIAALGTLKVARAVHPITEVLTDQSHKQRYIAAWALGEIKDPASISSLIGALDDPNFEVRRNAVRALTKIHGPAVTPLLKALPAASPQAAAGIIRTLGDLADPRALEPLLAQARGPNREEVMLALGKLRNSRAAKALIMGLDDPDWRVRMNASMALGPLGERTAIEPLRRTLEDQVEVVREWSARSLEMITGECMLYRNAKGEMVPPDNVYH